MSDMFSTWHGWRWGKIGSESDANTFMRKHSKAISSRSLVCVHVQKDQSDWFSWRRLFIVHFIDSLSPLPYLLGPGHIPPPVLSPGAQHSATLGEASLAIMYFASLSPRDILERGERADLTEGLRRCCQLCLSLCSPFMPPYNAPLISPPPEFGGRTWQHSGLKAM